MPDIDFQRIELNLIPKKGDEPVVFYASQYETARPFIADLMWGDTEFAPGDDSWAEIDIRKNDDNVVVITDDVTIDNNEVSVILPVQAVTCIGKNLGQVKIYAADDQLIAALNFILEVQADPLAGGVTSETAIDNLTQQIEDIATEVIGEDYYDKTEVDALLADKADVSDLPDMSQYYTKTATDTLLNAKADKTDTYTKAQVDSALAAKANTADLATVATTGDYDDLINKPTIPAAQIQSDYTQADITAVDYIKNKPDISGMIAAALLAVMPVETATGNPCTFDTDIATELQGLTADIVATGGGGTPSTPIPIVGHSELNLVRCGKNFIEQPTYSANTPSMCVDLGADITFDNLTLSFTANNAVAGATNAAVIDFRKSDGTHQYRTLSVFVNEQGVSFVNPNTPYSGRFSNTVSDITFRYCYIYYLSNSWSAITSDSLSDFQLELGSTATPYESFKGDTATISFGQTVYGGEYDANAGKVRLTWGKTSYDGSSDETWSGSGHIFYTPLNELEKLTDYTGKIVCDKLEAVARNNLMVNDYLISGYNDNGSSYPGQNWLYVRITDSINTASDLKTWLSSNPIDVIYVLTTPIEIDVSELSVDTIVGVNNITSDCNGDVTASYKVSIQKYVDDQ